jgi:hypothetical protein
MAKVLSWLSWWQLAFHACPSLLEQPLFGDVGGLATKASRPVHVEVLDIRLANHSQHHRGPHSSHLGNGFVLLGCLGSSAVRLVFASGTSASVGVLDQQLTKESTEVDECGLAEIGNSKEETRGTQFRQVRPRGA